MANDQSAFVEKNIRKKLLAAGYGESQITNAVHVGVQHYKQSPFKGQGAFTKSFEAAKEHLKGTKKAS